MTPISKNQAVTSVAGQTEYSLTPAPGISGQEVTVFIVLVSGSVQFAVGEDVATKHATWSTAGDKIILTVNTSNDAGIISNAPMSLRAKGVATWNIDW